MKFNKWYSMYMEFHAKNIDDVKNIVVSLIKNISIDNNRSGATIVTLSGVLGAGKTYFTQILGKELGVFEHIVSPTFVIRSDYDTKNDLFSKLTHIDLYRFENEKEMETIDWKNISKDTNRLIIIEWPERASSYIIGNEIPIQISIEEDDSRKFNIPFKIV